MLEVSSSTRVRDVCESISAKLQLASWEGCSLFIKIADKVSEWTSEWAGGQENRLCSWEQMCAGWGKPIAHRHS